MAKEMGQYLLDRGAITQMQLDWARNEAKQSGQSRIEVILKDKKLITEQEYAEALKDVAGFQIADLINTKIDPTLTQFIPRSVAEKYEMVPYKLEGNTLYVALNDPYNFYATEEVKNLSKKRVKPMVAYETQIKRMLNVLYENNTAEEAIKQMQEEQLGDAGGIARFDDNGASAAPTVRLVNSILERSIAEKASDIHIEPTENDMQVRIRVDGHLQTMEFNIPKTSRDAIISRLKIISNMNIAERRIPQDGRVKYKRNDGSTVDLRVNTLPTLFGEKVVIRILSRDSNTLNRKGIGMTDHDANTLERVLKNSSGMILVVGPTGSGKTSTLYTMINDLNKPDVNMISLEDPVEFQIDGVTQVEINEKVGLTFASALRACLRQDPDIICVGEIRDGETATIAMQAAMTGHLVLSTIHTEDAVSAIDRLRDLGAESYMIGGSLRGIISQRLVRRICTNCKEETTPDPDVLDLVGIKDPENHHFYHGKGCPECFGTGYRGRIGVFEMLAVNSDLRDAISSGINGTDLRKKVAELDFIPMITNGQQLAYQGITTIEELLRSVATV